MKATPIPFLVLALSAIWISGCETHAEEGEAHHEEHQIVATSPLVKDVVLTEEYVCQIHSRRHIEICALERGYLEQIPIKEGQAVKAGDLLFKILPTLYHARLDAALAEVRTAQLEVENSKKLLKDKVVSPVDVALHEAKLAKAVAEAKLAEAELNFTSLKAPFDGIVDRLHEQQGSLVEEGNMLTTLSDNSLMWVYFNVPEARYLEYMATQSQDTAATTTGTATASANAGDSADQDVDDQDDVDDKDDDDDDDDEHGHVHKEMSTKDIELILANGKKFPQAGAIGAIEADFNNETGNIAFRADFPNPNGVLRHGQTGNVLIHRSLEGALVIPQRASYEILDKRFVYVIGDDGTVRQREIGIRHEMDDIFVIEKGLEANDKIVLEGVRQVHDGEKVEFEFLEPKEALANLKHHAE